MDAILTPLDDVSGIKSLLLVIALLGIVNAWLTYSKEKGKNLATKEDIKELTRRVEAVKFEFENKGQIHAQQRQVYAEIAAASRVFLAGGVASAEAKERFLEAYNLAWLWAADEVLDRMIEFLNLQIQHAKVPQDPDEIKLAYSRLMVTMRSDAAVLKGNRTRKTDEYQFVRF